LNLESGSKSRHLLNPQNKISNGGQIKSKEKYQYLLLSTRESRFKWLTLILNQLEIITDMITFGFQLNKENYILAALTIVFIILPMILIPIYSLYVYKNSDLYNGPQNKKWILILHCIPFVAPIIRTMRAIKFNERLKRQTAHDVKVKTYIKFVYEEYGSTFLGLIEGTAEALPQLTLSCYTIVLRFNEPDSNISFTGFLILTALFSLASISFSRSSAEKSRERFSITASESLSSLLSVVEILSINQPHCGFITSIEDLL